MQQHILIEADYNDGDYVWSKSPITVEQLKEIEPMIEALNNNDGDYRTGDCGDKRNNAYDKYQNIPGAELFHEFAPYSEYGVHTIESIEIIEVIKKLY